MKIKLSKSKWQSIGKKAGWIKSSSNGDKKDYKKIDIYVDGKYKSSTNWAKSCAEAKTRYLEKNKDIVPSSVRCNYSKK